MKLLFYVVGMGGREKVRSTFKVGYTFWVKTISLIFVHQYPHDFHHLPCLVILFLVSNHNI